jgi:dihydropteroate synthase
MVEEGADILDLGAESTRPGSAPVEPAEELNRLLPVLRAIRKAHPEIPISVDTRKAAVASEALDAGADLINDISAGLHDPAMLPLLGARRAPVILMHMRGTPETMQDAPSYRDPVAEVAGELAERVSAAKAAGLGPGSIVVDPGIGFGKRPGDNLALLAGIPTLCALGAPVMVGVSRKSLVGYLTGAPAEARLPGTLALHAVALLAGARIFRVHDVAEHRQALTCAAAVMGAMR